MHRSSLPNGSRNSSLTLPLRALVLAVHPSFGSLFIISLAINSPKGLFALAADYKRISSYTEELVQNARDRPNEACAILEPCLAPLSATLADLENELRGAEYRLEGLLSRRSSLLSKLVDVQMLLGQSEH